MYSHFFKLSLLFLLPIWLFQSSIDSSKQSNRADKPTVHTVIIEGMKFKPAKLEVKKGDIVVFINKDFVDHDATEVNKDWVSPKLKPNDVWKVTIEKSAQYYCSLHEVMKGEIIVKN